MESGGERCGAGGGVDSGSVAEIGAALLELSKSVD